MSFIKEMLQYAIIIGIVILIRVFVITPVKVDGDSMNPTLVDGEVVMLNKISKNYERFDVVVVNYANTKLIKRIIGLPGEHIKFINNKLYINNKLVHDVKLDTKTSNFDIKQINYDVIPEDSYFVVGDNRANSTDSRIIGPIKKSDVVGKASIIIFPFNKFGKVE